MAQLFRLKSKILDLIRLKTSLTKEARWQNQHVEPARSSWQLVALISGAIAVLGLGFLTSYQVRRNATFTELEEQRELLSLRIHHIRVRSKMWGYGNDSFRFISNQHPDFAELHLRDPDLLGNKVVMLFFDLDGNLAFNSEDYHSSQLKPGVLKELQRCFTPHRDQLNTALQSLTKLCKSSSETYLMSASTIANDTLEAPVGGFVGVFTPVGAMPSAKIHNTHLEKALSQLERSRLFIGKPNHSQLWNAALPVDREAGLDIQPPNGATISAPIVMSHWDALKTLAPLGILSSFIAIHRNWSLIRRRRMRLIRLNQHHLREQLVRRQQQHDPAHGLLSTSTFARWFAEDTRWNWDKARILVRIQINTHGGPQRSYGSEITLTQLLPSMCGLLRRMGHRNTGCQTQDGHAALLCFAPNEAEPIHTQIEELRSRCDSELHHLYPLKSFSITATYQVAKRETNLHDQDSDLALTATAAQMLGRKTMALDRSDPMFDKAWRLSQLKQELIEIAIGTRQIKTRYESVYECPKTDRPSWRLHHKRLILCLKHTEDQTFSHDEVNQLTSELDVGSILFEKLLSQAAQDWSTSPIKPKIEISSGPIHQHNITGRSAEIRERISQLPRDFTSDLIINLATQETSNQEIAKLEEWLRMMGAETLQVAGRANEDSFNLHFERTSNYLTINCHEMSTLNTDTLSSLHRFLQDAGRQMGYELIGASISTEAQFHFWHKLGLTLFTGPWITHHASLSRSG